ncbi:hypothetical protein LTS17_010549 [Exophiala oligosperma]
MRQTPYIDKSRTCRYWALGSGCPNFDAFGAVTCSYAHWDTGRLVSHFQQRGTCIQWKYYGYCGRGAGCWYEHRHTGVDGLYQGTVDLGGVELEIADAATKAGFDTFNHEALFELIWAISSRQRCKKWKKKNNANPVRRPPNHDVELKFHPVKPLMRKRPHEDVKEEEIIDLTAASDTLERPAQPGSPSIPLKRQKTFKCESASKNGMQTISSIPKTTVTYSIPTRSAGESRATDPGPRTSTPGPAFKPQPPITPEAEITKQLNLVKKKLDDARININTCQSAMKDLFDVYCHKFENDQIMASLQKLSNCMNNIYDSSKDGASEIDTVVKLLIDRKNIKP